MMSQGKTPGKDPQWGLQGSEAFLTEKTPQTPVKPPRGDLNEGSFPGTSLTEYTVHLKFKIYLHTLLCKYIHTLYNSKKKILFLVEIWSRKIQTCK